MLHSLRHQQSHDPGGLTKDHNQRDHTEKNGSKGPRRRSSGLRFFASAPMPSTQNAAKSQKKWEADYLKDLREHRPTRPGGSRPLPGRQGPTAADLESRAPSAMSLKPTNRVTTAASSNTTTGRSSSAMSHRPARSETRSDRASPDFKDPSSNPDLQKAATAQDNMTSTKSGAETPSPVHGFYQENGLRWMEKQEAKSLRAALEDMDSLEEAKVHAAAQAEASDLVNAHRKSGMEQPRDSNRLRNYREHLEKGAHARSLSQAWEQNAILIRDFQDPIQTTSSEKPVPSHLDKSETIGRDVSNSHSMLPATQRESENPGQKGHHLWDSPERKAYMNMTFPMPLRKVSGRRKSSGPRARDSMGGLFRNPEDKIYEEPQETTKQIRWADSTGNNTNAPLTDKRPNSASNVQRSREPILQLQGSEFKPFSHRSEIHRNPPSQSRNPSYVKNETPDETNRSSMTSLHGNSNDGDTKHNMEIRSDEIRAATSKKLKDRSTKLPTPTAVSRRSGRPIVSFDPGYSPAKESAKLDSSPNWKSHDSVNGTPVSSPAPPVININLIPSIQVEAEESNGAVNARRNGSFEGEVPTISVSEEPPNPRPLPRASTLPRSSMGHRPLPHHSSTDPVASSKIHWSAIQPRTTTQCASCGLPISGRIVSAAGERFHPQCFSCHHCATALECVAFYPEPQNKRDERLARIHARLNGNCMPEEGIGESADDDGDESLRFFCHLDFHELFSPRCKSCKTPIESHVIVACGNTWHVGHFFCAECGDPFEADTPFVDKDGYAWCVRCHAGRFSGKCKGCRKPIVTEGVQALDAEWHANCFVCSECNGNFEDGRFFTREDEQSPVCVTCEEKRLKA